MSRRFNLLLLEENEFFFEDYICYRYKGRDHIKEKGRIKICSRSLVFEPDNISDPIVKFPFKAMNKPPHPYIWSKSSEHYSTNSENLTFRIIASKSYEMKANDITGPYTERILATDEDSISVFSFAHTQLDAILPFIDRLYRIACKEVKGFSRLSDELEKVIMERQRVDFDRALLVDFREKFLFPSAMMVTRVRPMVSNPGCIMLTDSQLYFQPATVNNIGEVVSNYPLSKIYRVLKRRYLLRQVGLEIFIGDAESVFFSFQTKEDREKLYNKLMEAPALKPSARNRDERLLGEATVMWQKGLMDNYEYLMYLNSLADRSFSDLTQYPVMPWVISNYSSNELNLDDPNTFRDLSKPIGALNPKRLEYFLARYKEQPHEPGMNPPFLYGTHYSTPGYVLFYLLRLHPEWMLCLQNGKFDAPDRLFHNMSDTFKGILENPGDLKELIPEFYSGSGEFLLNAGGLNFGVRHDGELVDNVELPPWAVSAPDFVIKCRAALESDYVSSHLHEWIDLVFGYKQQGPEAIKANNVFYYLTYEGAVDLDNVKDATEKQSYELQIREFGQTPKQLFTAPHPPRVGKNKEFDPSDWKLGRQTRKRSSVTAKPVMPLFDIASPPIPAPVSTVVTQPSSSNTSVASPSKKSSPKKMKSEIIREESVESWTGDHVHWKSEFSLNLHRGEVTSAFICNGNKTIVTTSSDSYLKVHNIPTNKTRRSANMSELSLSSSQLLDDNGARFSVLVGSWDNSIYLYEVETARVVDKLVGHHDAITCLAYKENTLISGSWDASARIWKVTESGFADRVSSDEIDADAEVNTVDIDGYGNIVAAGSTEGQVLLYDIRCPPANEPIGSLGETIVSIKLSKDGHKFLLATKDGSIQLYQADGLLLVRIDTGEEITAMQASTDLNNVLTGGVSGKVKQWNLIAEEEVKNNLSSFKNDPVTCLGLSSLGNELIVGNKNGVVNIYSIGK